VVRLHFHGRVAELADAQDSGSCEVKLVGVQVPLRPRQRRNLRCLREASGFSGERERLRRSLGAAAQLRVTATSKTRCLRRSLGAAAQLRVTATSKTRCLRRSLGAAAQLRATGTSLRSVPWEKPAASPLDPRTVAFLLDSRTVASLVEPRVLPLAPFLPRFGRRFALGLFGLPVPSCASLRLLTVLGL
jgi:hypothetical protein